MPAPELRLRVTSPELLALPWRLPLADWDITLVDLRDIPVGPSRHLVRFVHADGRLWAVKSLPPRIAAREYGMLRALEDRALAAVRPTGTVVQGADDALLVTAYLERSWQYRRLLMRIPTSQHSHRGRLFEAMATLLVDLHRNGVYWGDCSLANTLFMRDGQTIQAWLVDAETAELQPSLTDGQRAHDLEIMIENVTGGLLDAAARREEPPDVFPQIFAEAQSVVDRYERLWALLHDEPVVGLGERDRIGDRVRGLEDAGFAVDEVRFEPAGADEDDDAVRMKVAVAGRRFHTDRLRALTGLEAGEGQARILMDDLHSHHERLRRVLGDDVTEAVGARHWLLESFLPARRSPTRPCGAGAIPCRPTATCSRCGGCSARMPATTSVTSRRSRPSPIG